MLVSYRQLTSNTASTLRSNVITLSQEPVRPAVQEQYALKISPPVVSFLITAQILHVDDDVV